MTEIKSEIVFLNIPSDLSWDAAPFLDLFYRLGIHKIHHTVTAAEESAIEGVVAAAVKRADLVCVMGMRNEVGPETDERFRKLLHRISRKRLVLHERQTLLPAGTIYLIDPHAHNIPVFIISFAEPVSPTPTLLIMTPGGREVVHHFSAKIKEIALSFLMEKEETGRWIRMCDVTENDLSAWIKKEPFDPSLRVTLLSQPAGVDMVIASNKPASLDEAVEKIQKKWGRFCYSLSGESMEEVVGKALLTAGKQISIAESCTGGAIAARITRVPGASRYFDAAFVTYSNRSKEASLSISRSWIEKKGAVSPEVAIRMAEGARKTSGADLGLSVTGIAGPTGGSREKPVGRVFIALSDGKKTTVSRYRFRGSREMIRAEAAQMALETVRQYLIRDTV